MEEVFIYALFNDAVSNRRMIVNKAMERIWVKDTVALFELIHRRLHAGKVFAVHAMKAYG